MPRPRQEKLIGKAIRLLHLVKSQQEVARACKVSVRTIARWVSQSSEELPDLKPEEKAIVETDPLIMTVVELREQVQQILDYRDSQRFFAQRMGLVVQRSTNVLLKAIERLEQNPDELTARTLPQLMRAISDCSEKVSNSWARSAGLDGLIENLGVAESSMNQAKFGSERNFK